MPTDEVEAAIPLYLANMLYMDTDLSKRIQALFYDIRAVDTIDPSKAGEYADKMKAQRDSIEGDFRVVLGSELEAPPPARLGSLTPPVVRHRNGLTSRASPWKECPAGTAAWPSC